MADTAQANAAVTTTESEVLSPAETTAIAIENLKNIDIAKGIEQEMEQVSAVYQMIVEFFVAYSFQLVGAFLVMALGVYVAGKIGKIAERMCTKRDIDVTLAGFIASSVRIIVIVMVSVIALGKLGISVTPFLAAIGALSLGAGLALQGVLSNYGAGFNIIITRPFVVGDTIEIQGNSGLVKTVQLAFTKLIDEDGTEITIPNKHITGEILHNSFTNKLAEITIGIAYSEDPERAIAIICRAIASIKELQPTRAQSILDEEEKAVPVAEHQTQVGIGGFGDSSIDIAIRAWIPTVSYHQLRFKLNATVYKALMEEGVKIPFPQREIRILNG